MSQPGDDLVFRSEEFSGQARLFPLPNLVLFPHVIQPLHVFEPRYVDLLRDAIERDRLIAMALLEPGWEDDYDGRPPIAPVACLGRVLTWQAQPDNRYNLLLLGLRRVRVVRELPAVRSFREAEVELVEDDYPACAAKRRPALHRKLVSAFEEVLPRIKDADELFDQLSVDTISLSTLTDVISYALDLDVRSKQLLLAEGNVDCRAQMLLTHLQRASAEACQLSVAAGFPPAFSEN
jgi:ATP-dependent Lon protease